MKHIEAQDEYHGRLAMRLLDAPSCISVEDATGAGAAILAIVRTSLQDGDDAERLDWLDHECRAGRVELRINGVPRGVGSTARGAIDSARKPN
jgi:hypothetical protein